MHISTKTPLLAALASLLVLAGCSSTRPLPYAGLASAPLLRPNSTDTSGRVPYRYSSGTDWSRYSSAMVERVAVYAGNDHQFEDMSAADKDVLAQYMDQHFRTALGHRFALVNVPTANTLRIRATLTGAKPNTFFLSTFSRFDIGGGPYNMVQAARGEEGALTG
ncbi:hypothetical protein BH10PSE18_BH10PSE18_17750 [soil metagenome]